MRDEARAEKIAKATGRAFAAPETFLRRLRLPRVTDDVPWLALIAALDKEKLVAKVDWREDVADVAACVDTLCARPALRPRLARALGRKPEALAKAPLARAYRPGHTAGTPGGVRPSKRGSG